MKPAFPLRILTDEGVEEIISSEDELTTSLEWFDSARSDGSVRVVDALDRPVVLRIEAMKIKVMEVRENLGGV